MAQKVITKKARLGLFDVLTGFATLLVVSGHQQFLEEYALWYHVYREIIYSFHMALFMFVSGFLIQYSYPSKSISYSQYVGRKLKKFLPAYFVVGIIASIIASSSIPEFNLSILLLFYDPINGSIQIIWYIYVLMIFYALMPFIIKLSPKTLFAVLPIALLLSLLSSNFGSIFCLQSITYLFFFFLLGVLACRSYINFKLIKPIYWLLLSTPFLIYLAFFIHLQHDPFTFLGRRTLSSILALPLCLWMGIYLDRVKCLFIQRIFSTLSKHAFSIYLWQMFVINALWVVFSRFSKWALTPYTTFVYLIISSALTIVICITLAIGYKKSMQWIQIIKSR